MKNIDIHADDFALSINSSKDIINCINKNKINSISIIPNMNCFSKCMKLLNNTKTSIEMSIHLNFFVISVEFEITPKFHLFLIQFLV